MFENRSHENCEQPILSKSNQFNDNSNQLCETIYYSGKKLLRNFPIKKVL
jgi:hypothetical protein